MRLFSTLIVLIATLVCFTYAAADEALIRKDIQDIDAQATALKESLVKTDGTNYAGALAIDAAAIRLTSSIQKATQDVRSINFAITDQNAAETLATLTNTAGSVGTISSRLIALHDAFVKLGVAAMAKDTLSKSDAASEAFGVVLYEKAPAGKKDAAKALSARIDGDLQKALAAYAKD